MIQSKRLFTNTAFYTANTEIQIRIKEIISKLPLEELNQFENIAYSKETFRINYALIVKVPVNSEDKIKKDKIKDHKGYNRWTWKLFV